MAYNIGLIEDNPTEVSEIGLSLIENSDRQLSEESIYCYKLEKRSGFKDELLKTIRKDILDNKIQCVLVDYKLDTLYEIVDGTDIVKYVHDIVPEFPVVILTNVPDAGRENSLADPDKVYSKREFLNPENEKTKVMVDNILKNIIRYSKKRSELESKQKEILDAMMDHGKYSDNEYENLLRIERQLARYSPIEISAADEEYKTSEMKEMVDLLKECKEFLR